MKNRAFETKPKKPERLEQGEAESLLAELRRRSRLGLASFKQLKKVKKECDGEFDPHTITMSQAHLLISQGLRSKGKGYLVDRFETRLGQSRLGNSRI